MESVISTNNHPNMFPIRADQWRGDCLGFAGSPLVETPHLNQPVQPRGMLPTFCAPAGVETNRWRTDGRGAYVWYPQTGTETLFGIAGDRGARC